MAGTSPAMTKKESLSRGKKELGNTDRIFSQVLRRRISAVSKDGRIGASWFETRKMRSSP
jgi:hypothetical protein